MKIGIRINGGLGNQLFQYAAALALAKQWKCPIVIEPPRKCKEQFLARPRIFALNEFSLSAKIQRLPLPINILWRLLTRGSGSDLIRWIRRLLSIEIIEEKHGNRFDGALLENPPHSHYTLLRGYWQTVRWAERVETELRKELQPIKDLSPASQVAQKQIRSSTPSVSLHVRRGDYLQINGATTLPGSYYKKAILEMIGLLTARQTWSDSPTKHHDGSTVVEPYSTILFFVFSDDIPWCRNVLPSVLESRPASTARIQVRLEFVDANDEEHAVDDLRLMAACDHHIIANSSFSWWGAWLNVAPGKIVMAPKYWMQSADSHFPDLCPSNWILIDNLHGD